jgi:transposase
VISKEEFIVIHTLKEKGYSIRHIAKTLCLDRRTVAKRLKEKELQPYKSRKYPSKLDSYKEYIKKRVIDTLPNRIPAPVVLEEIKKQGYKGSIRILQEYIRIIIQSPKKEEKLIRFETDPGFQAQVDWTTIRSGKNPIYAFVMILGYSRMAFAYFTDNMKQETWQECHIKAFEYFGGTPQTILYDNLKSVVIKRDKYGKNRHGFNNDFLDFARDNFIPKLCKPYRAQTKGKVERLNLYLKNNFYIPLKSALKGSDIIITPWLLNNKIFSWLEKANTRIHGTTKQRPVDLLEKEKSFLQPFYVSIKSNNKTKKESFSLSSSNMITQDIIKNKEDIAIPNIDISYHTTISDYENILGGLYATS